MVVEQHILNKALLNDSTKEPRCCEEFLVWVGWEKSVFFKEISQHAGVDFSLPLIG